MLVGDDSAVFDAGDATAVLRDLRIMRDEDDGATLAVEELK